MQSGNSLRLPPKKIGDGWRPLRGRCGRIHPCLASARHSSPPGACCAKREELADETIPAVTELYRTVEALTVARATIKSEGSPPREENAKPHRQPHPSARQQLADGLLSYLRDFGRIGASQKRLSTQASWDDLNDHFA